MDCMFETVRDRLFRCRESYNATTILSFNSACPTLAHRSKEGCKCPYCLHSIFWTNHMIIKALWNWMEVSRTAIQTHQHYLFIYLLMVSILERATKCEITSFYIGSKNGSDMIKHTDSEGLWSAVADERPSVPWSIQEHAQTETPLTSAGREHTL